MLQLEHPQDDYIVRYVLNPVSGFPPPTEIDAAVAAVRAGIWRDYLEVLGEVGTDIVGYDLTTTWRRALSGAKSEEVVTLLVQHPEYGAAEAMLLTFPRVADVYFAWGEKEHQDGELEAAHIFRSCSSKLDEKMTYLAASRCRSVAEAERYRWTAWAAIRSRYGRLPQDAGTWDRYSRATAEMDAVVDLRLRQLLPDVSNVIELRMRASAEASVPSELERIRTSDEAARAIIAFGAKSGDGGGNAGSK